MADILTLEKYKIYKGITTNEYDAQLEAYIDAINDFIEDYCNREFGEDEYREKKEGLVDHLLEYVFYVQNRPIISVQELKLKYIGTTQEITIDPDKLDIFNKAGYAYYAQPFDPPEVVLRDEYRDRFYYTITYSGGEPVPKSVELAAVTAVSDTFEYFNRTNTALASGTQQVGELKSVKIGEYTETYATGDTLFKSTHESSKGNPGGIVLTQTVKDLLNPYRVVSQSW